MNCFNCGDPGSESESDSTVEDKNGCLNGAPEDHGFVNMRDGVNMFYWLRLKTVENVEPHEIPLAIYLEGGPGGSATGRTNIELIGPCNRKLEKRQSTWLNHMHLLFIDSPVGVGYSYFTDPKYAATKDKEVANDLYMVLEHFFSKHEHLRKAPLHIFGASYGAKAAVELTWLLHDKKFDCKLTSVISLFGLISPIDTAGAYAPFLQQLGLIDQKNFDVLAENADVVRANLMDKKFIDAYNNDYRSIYTIERVFGIDLHNVVNSETVWNNAESNLSRCENVCRIKYKMFLFMIYEYTDPKHDDLNLNFGADNENTELKTFMRGTVTRMLRVRSGVEWNAQASRARMALRGAAYDSVYDTGER